MHCKFRQHIMLVLCIELQGLRTDLQHTHTHTRTHTHTHTHSRLCSYIFCRLAGKRHLSVTVIEGMNAGHQVQTYTNMSKYSISLSLSLPLSHTLSLSPSLSPSLSLS